MYKKHEESSAVVAPSKLHLGRTSAACRAWRLTPGWEAARLLQEAEAYEASKVALAQGEASRFTQVLEEYLKAPEITRDRLYLEAMESVLGNSTKLIIDQESGGNNVMYLPLDQLIKGQQSRSTAAAGENIGSNDSTSGIRDRPRRGSRTSGRVSSF